MKRKIYNKLLEWKRESNGEYALLIDGARRVGKSYIVKQFAEKMGTPTMRFEPTVFLENLKAQVGIVEYSNAKNNFPQSASALGKKIPRIQTALSAVGIDITQKKSSGKRLIIITRRF